jgi:hypothetical protein
MPVVACWYRSLAWIGVLIAAALAPHMGRAQETPAVQPPAVPPQALTVELSSGRRFTGLVDARTSDERLVLRFTRDGATLRRSIEWDRVVGASVSQQQIDPGQLKATVLAMRSKGSGTQRVPGVQGSEDSRPPTSDLRPPTPDSPTSDSPTSDPRLPTPDARVTSVTFDARIANWDGDVETDGLVVELFPIDEDGYAVPARGTVEVELFAPQLRDFNHAPLSGGDTLERVNRWTQAVESEDFTTRGMRLKLPFAAVHPEFDLDRVGMGLVHVRLVVPGDGVFEDSIDGLRIRPYAPLRDRLEMTTGRRFVPTEGVGRGRVLHSVGRR